MTLVTTREKLKPFVDDGVVHKDRKRQVKRGMVDFTNQKKNAELEERICEYKVKMIQAIQDRNIKTLENIVQELSGDLDETPDNDYVVSCLRLNIIHA